MPFDMEKWHATAHRGDVAGLSIELAIALGHIASAIDRIARKAQVDVKDETNEVRRIATQMDNRFEELTGYTADE